MRLKRLIVHGFKSFKDRTSIHFDDGITGIVGPNGCGKSNIVDALFWVMGEQSAKHLRGSNMKDLIFSGSDKYTPGAWAEVTLVLDNDDKKHIHIGNQVSCPSEIQITRKLYRNSETEYRINNSICRLRDIQEVFMDTGAGAKSYSIIAQGEINRLVQSKPEERRVMIEEVAGITKFKIRKRESLRKIEQTQTNLNRLCDLQTEIDKNIRVLQNQAEKARKARDLKGKIETNELIVDSHREYELLKNYREGKSILTTYTEDLETWTARRNVLELSLEDERIKKDAMSDRLDGLQDEYNTLSKELAAAEERLNYLKKSVEEKNIHIVTRTKESEELQAEIEGRQQRLETLNHEKEELDATLDQDDDFGDLEEKVEDLKESVDLKEEQVSSLREEIENIRERYQVLSKEEYINTSKLEEHAGNLLELNEELGTLEDSNTETSNSIKVYNEEIDDFSQKVETLSSEKSGLQEEINEKTVAHEELDQLVKKLSTEIIQIESKVKSLTDLNESLEGINEGATNFLKSNQSQDHALIGRLIQCPQEYTKAVSSLLADLLETIISKKNDSEAVVGWYNSNSDSSIEFYQHGCNAASVANGFEEYSRLSDIVTISPEYQSQFASLLSGYYIGENIDFTILPDTVEAIATPSGDRLLKKCPGGTVIKMIGNDDNDQGIVARNNRIKMLSDELSEKCQRFAAIENEAKLSASSLKDKIERNEIIRDELVELDSTVAVKKAQREKIIESGNAIQTRLSFVQDRISEIEESQSDMQEASEVLTEEVDQLSQSLDDKKEQYDDLSESLIDEKSNYDDYREMLLEKQIEAKSINDRMTSLVSQLDDVAQQLKRQTERLKSNEKMVNDYINQVENLENEVSTLAKDNGVKAGELSDKEQVLSDSKYELNQLLAQMQEREDEVKKIGRDINKADKKVVEFEIKLEQYIADEEHVVRNIFEKYQIDFRDILGKFLEYQEDEYEDLRDISQIFITETEFGPKELVRKDYEFVKRYDKDLKERISRLKKYKQDYNQLGEINWQAIDDYERQKKRSNFLKEQASELNQSIANLENAIEQIDSKSRERFKIAFEEVNERFEKVFPIIFGGGNASLKVIGDITEVDCGVDIIAQPPGKKMQNINLMSGGEKAMTAVSLIFSIFLVKPSPFCLLDEVDAPLDDANVGRFNELLREMSADSQFILITHNKKTMEMNDTLYGITMQEPGISKAVSVQLH